MNTNNFNLLKSFLISAIATGALLFISCLLWTDLELTQVANVMFWVGAVTLIVGGSFFYPYNRYQGQSVAIMTTLRDKAPENSDTIKSKEKNKTRRMIQGLSIASPGIILIIMSWLIFSKI